MMVLVFYWQKVTLRSSSLALQLRHTKHLPTYRLFIFRSCPFFEIQSNLAIRNFLVALKSFLSAKSSLSLWSKWQIGQGKCFLNTNLFLIKPFLIDKFDCTTSWEILNCFWNILVMICSDKKFWIYLFTNKVIRVDNAFKKIEASF